MRRLLLAIVLLACATSVQASWTETGTGHAKVSGTGATAAISIAAFNSGSANEVACLVGYYNADPTTAFITSSPSLGTWTATATTQSGADGQLNIIVFKIDNPTNQASTTITFTPTAAPAGNYPSMNCYALTQGASTSFDAKVGSGSNFGGAPPTGSIGTAGELVIEGIVYYTTPGPTISWSGGATILESAYSAGQAMGLASTWKSVTGAENPTWTDNSGNSTATIGVSFVAGSPPASSACTLSLLGVGKC